MGEHQAEMIELLKQLDEVDKQLKEMAMKYERENNKPFLVYGENIVDHIASGKIQESYNGPVKFINRNSKGDRTMLPESKVPVPEVQEKTFTDHNNEKKTKDHAASSEQ